MNQIDIYTFLFPELAVPDDLEIVLCAGAKFGKHRGRDILLQRRDKDKFAVILLNKKQPSFFCDCKIDKETHTC